MVLAVWGLLGSLGLKQGLGSVHRAQAQYTGFKSQPSQCSIPFCSYTVHLRPPPPSQLSIISLCFGSGSIWNHIYYASWIRTYRNSGIGNWNSKKIMTTFFLGWDFVISFSLIIIIYLPVPVPYHFLWHKSSMKENIFSYKVTMEKIRFCVCFSDFSEIYFIRKNLKIKIKDFLFII